MSLTLTEFSALQRPVAVTIHSLEGSLYCLTARIDGKDTLLLEDSGKAYRSRKLPHIRELLDSLPVASLTLRQESAYDEMVGQPAKAAGQRLEINLPVKQSD